MRYKNEFIDIFNGVQVQQVNKTTAKKLYDQGKQLYLNACNMRINNAWQDPMPLDNAQGYSFNLMLSEYEYYNCCSERGNYANFFTPTS